MLSRRAALKNLALTAGAVAMASPAPLAQERAAAAEADGVFATA
jgi:hypothetical protein